MIIYDAIAQNGALKKGKKLTASSLRKLKLFDLVYIDDVVYSVAGFNEKNELFFACAESQFVVDTNNGCGLEKLTSC